MFIGCFISFSNNHGFESFLLYQLHFQWLITNNDCNEVQTPNRQLVICRFQWPSANWLHSFQWYGLTVSVSDDHAAVRISLSQRATLIISHSSHKMPWISIVAHLYIQITFLWALVLYTTAPWTSALRSSSLRSIFAMRCLLYKQIGRSHWTRPCNRHVCQSQLQLICKLLNLKTCFISYNSYI